MEKLSKRSNNQKRSRAAHQSELARVKSFIVNHAESVLCAPSNLIYGDLALRNTACNFITNSPCTWPVRIPIKERSGMCLDFHKCQCTKDACGSHYGIWSLSFFKNRTSGYSLFESVLVPGVKELRSKSSAKDPMVCLKKVLPDVLGAVTTRGSSEDRSTTCEGVLVTEKLLEHRELMTSTRESDNLRRFDISLVQRMNGRAVSPQEVELCRFIREKRFDLSGQ